MADRAAAATLRGASVQPPNFVDFVIITACFNAVGFGWIWLNLPETSGQIIQVIRYDDYFPIGNAHELVGILRLRILPGLFVDAPGQFTIDVLRSCGRCHGWFLPW